MKTAASMLSARPPQAPRALAGLALALAAWFAFWLAAPAGARAAEISGRAWYRERIAIPAAAELVVTLAPREGPPVAEAREAVNLRADIPFRLQWDEAKGPRAGRYGLSAEVVVNGHVMFRSAVLPVSVRGARKPVRLRLLRAREAAAAPGAARAQLVGPTWIAEDIGGGGVIDRSQSRVTLEGGRASGHSGCNRFAGGYALEGERLSFRQLAGTMMACPPAMMDQERKFLAALTATRGYRFENGLLILTGADGAPLARFWREK